MEVIGACNFPHERGIPSVMWCGVVWCGVMWWDVTWYDMWWGVMGDVVWCDVWCDVVWLCDVTMWCDVMVWCDVVWCDISCDDVMTWCDKVMWCDEMFYRNLVIKQLSHNWVLSKPDTASGYRSNIHYTIIAYNKISCDHCYCTIRKLFSSLAHTASSWHVQQ